MKSLRCETGFSPLPLAVVLGVRDRICLKAGKRRASTLFASDEDCSACDAFQSSRISCCSHGVNDEVLIRTLL